MRKAINISALLFFVWLVLDAFDILSLLINFLLVGALPGSSVSVSPSIMLAIMATLAGIIIFELLARRFGVLRQLRYRITHLDRYERLPKRRFGRA